MASSGSAPQLYAGTVNRPPPYAPVKDEPPSYGSINTGYSNYPKASAPPLYPPGGQINYYQPQPQPPALPPQTNITQQQYTTQVVVVGGCPACRVGILEDDFTLLGVCCAIVFFPLGILCCLAMRQRRCPNCGASFG